MNVIMGLITFVNEKTEGWNSVEADNLHGALL